FFFFPVVAVVCLFFYLLHLHLRSSSGLSREGILSERSRMAPAGSVLTDSCGETQLKEVPVS
ncbi:hypothetical protein Nmel_005074, partial [Mimus melanotis]